MQGTIINIPKKGEKKERFIGKFRNVKVIYMILFVLMKTTNNL